MVRTTAQVITSSYDGTNINANVLQGLFLEHRSEDRTIRGGFSRRLGVSGRLQRPKRNDGLTILYIGHIQADVGAVNPESDLRTKIRAAEALFDSESHGDLVELMEDGSTRTLDCFPRFSYDRWNNPERATCSVVFESWEVPDWEYEEAGS